MRHVNGVYTQKFNRLSGRSGHLFQGRYKAILVEKESYLLELVRYIVLNPVRAKLARHCKDWKWSSYSATAGLEESPHLLHVDWILSQFAREPSRAQKAFRKFVDDGRDVEIWDSLQGQIYLGSDSFIAQHVPQGSAAFREIPREQRLVDRPSLEEIFEDQTSDKGILDAYRSYGYRMKEIANHLCVHYSTVSRCIRKYEESSG